MSYHTLNKVILYAIIVGLILIPISYLGSYLAKFITKKPSLPEVCKQWNKHYIMEISVFLTGFLLVIIAEYTGLLHSLKNKCEVETINIAKL